MPVKQVTTEHELSTMNQIVEKYYEVALTTDMSQLSEEQKQVLSVLIDAAKIMDELFWKQAYGNKQELLGSIKDKVAVEAVKINYGPWDRLNGNEPFITGFEAKPLGANFYPKDIPKEEFERVKFPYKDSQYSMVKRDSLGNLYAIPYHRLFKTEINQVAKLLDSAADITTRESFKKYLKLRSKALLRDDYFRSDLAWMDMKDNELDIVIGPIETYEDQFLGNKAAFSSYVLVKDMVWSQKLDQIKDYLPQLQKGLPVEDKYRQENPGTDSDLNVYDVVYYAGDCNAGSKTIAINLPNDENVQLKKGTRRLQLKNSIEAKFNNILLPISEELIEPSQRKYVTFDAFFNNIMFHEIAHGLGVKNTINDKGTVRDALQEYAGTIEEGKADILGLYMLIQLERKNQIKTDLNANMVAFMAGIFRSIRFGASSSHGKANLMRFNYFKEQDAFIRTEAGYYKVNFNAMETAIRNLSQEILRLQAEGDYEGVKKFIQKYTVMSDLLKQDLERLEENKIPVDVIFKQGKDVLGLN